MSSRKVINSLIVERAEEKDLDLELELSKNGAALVGIGIINN